MPLTLSPDQTPTIAAPGHPARVLLAPWRPGTAEPGRRSIDLVDEWGMQSFPASDPPANW